MPNSFNFMTKKFDYHLTGLPQNTLVGNTLYVPVLDRFIDFEVLEKDPATFCDKYKLAVKNPDPPCDKYRLEFKTAQGGLWLAYRPMYHCLLEHEIALDDPEPNLSGGSLAKVHIIYQSGNPNWFGRYTQFELEKITLETALSKGHLIERTYEEAFKRLEIFKFYKNGLSELPEARKKIFQVQKVDNSAITIIKYFSGSKPKEKPIKEKLKDMINGLLPQPTWNPQPVKNLN